LVFFHHNPQNTDRLLQRAAAAGSKLVLSVEEALGEEKAVIKRLFDATVTDYTMGSKTFGKSLPNVLFGERKRVEVPETAGAGPRLPRTAALPTIEAADAGTFSCCRPICALSPLPPEACSWLRLRVVLCDVLIAWLSQCLDDSFRICSHDSSLTPDPIASSDGGLELPDKFFEKKTVAGKKKGWNTAAKKK
jgi:hypothetical protein